MHRSLDEFKIRPDPTTGFHGNRKCYNLKNGVTPFFSVVLDGNLFILTSNDDIHKSLDEFKFGQIRPRTTELAAFKRLKN